MSSTDISYNPPPTGEQGPQGEPGPAFEPAPRTWQSLDWITLYQSDEAPTPANGYPGAYWYDYVGGDLYGPATFDPGIPGWDWGSPLTDADAGVGAGNGPETAGPSVNFFVWDENEDNQWVLFQRKTAVEHDDLIRSQSGTSWEAVSNKMDADDVYYDQTAISNDQTNAITKSVKTELHNINTNLAYGYLGGREYIMETSVSGTYEINPFDGNAFILTITDDVTFTFTSGLNALDTYNLGTRFAEITVVLIQDETGGHTVGWSEGILFHNNEHNVSTGANHVGIWKFISWDDGSTWYGHRWGTTFA